MPVKRSASATPSASSAPASTDVAEEVGGGGGPLGWPLRTPISALLRHSPGRKMSEKRGTDSRAYKLTWVLDVFLEKKTDKEIVVKRSIITVKLTDTDGNGKNKMKPKFMWQK